MTIQWYFQLESWNIFWYKLHNLLNPSKYFTHSVKIFDENLSPFPIADAVFDKRGDDRDIRSEWEREMNLSVDDLESDEIMLLVIPAVVEDQAVLFLSCKTSNMCNKISTIKILNHFIWSAHKIFLRDINNRYSNDFACFFIRQKQNAQKYRYFGEICSWCDYLHWRRFYHMWLQWFYFKLTFFIWFILVWFYMKQIQCKQHCNRLYDEISVARYRCWSRLQ